MEEVKVCNVSSDEMKKMLDALPPNEIIEEMASFLKIFGDVTRVRILYVLFDRDLCVHDIATILNMSHSAISHQLRVLKQARLVKYRRSGKEMIYSLADEHVKVIFEQTLKHVGE